MATFARMHVGEHIKAIREKRGLLQKEVSAELGLDKSVYSKIERGAREVKVEELKKLAGLFDMSIDQIVNYEEDMPREVTLEDKTSNEQMKLFNQLEEEDKKAVFHIIDKMLTQKKFKEFFEQNVAK